MAGLGYGASYDSPEVTGLTEETAVNGLTGETKESEGMEVAEVRSS